MANAIINVQTKCCHSGLEVLGRVCRRAGIGAGPQQVQSVGAKVKRWECLGHLGAWE